MSFYTVRDFPYQTFGYGTQLSNSNEKNLIIRFLSVPLTLSFFCLFDDIADNARILGNLEIEHANCNEVRAVFKRVCEAAFGRYCAGS